MKRKNKQEKRVILVSKISKEMTWHLEMLNDASKRHYFIVKGEDNYQLFVKVGKQSREALCLPCHGGEMYNILKAINAYVKNEWRD